MWLNNKYISLQIFLNNYIPISVSPQSKFKTDLDGHDLNSYYTLWQIKLAINA